jgi:hypothetical protein
VSIAFYACFSLALATSHHQRANLSGLSVNCLPSFCAFFFTSSTSAYPNCLAQLPVQCGRSMILLLADFLLHPELIKSWRHPTILMHYLLFYMISLLFYLFITEDLHTPAFFRISSCFSTTDHLLTILIQAFMFCCSRFCT